MHSWVVLFFVFGLLFSCKPVPRADIHLLTEWYYQTGFEPLSLYSKPSKDSPDWKPIHIPQNFQQLPELKDYKGFLTLRSPLPPSIQKMWESGEPIAIDAGRLLDVSLLYINEEKFGGLGSVEPYQEAAMRPILRVIPSRGKRNQERAYLTLVLYNTGKYPLQVMDPISVGPAPALFQKRSFNEIGLFSLITIYFAAGIYHLWITYKRPKDLYNLFFGLFSILLGLYIFIANTYTRDLVFGSSVELHRRVEHAVLFLLPALMLYYLHTYFNGFVPKYIKITSLYYYLSSFLALVLPLSMMRTIRDVWYVLIIPFGIYTVTFSIRRVLQGHSEGHYFILGLLSLMIASVLDILSSIGMIEFPKVLSYTFLAFVVGLAGMMANRFMRVTTEVENLNANLEKMVEDRTEELKLTLNKAETLKDQQDGDYFLTSMLMRPLFIDSVSDEFVLVESFTEQKKKFNFRKWSSEIGGDIIITDRVFLRNREYVVMLNADAMGKSIQGAGGALVLGSVFRSILTRFTDPNRHDLQESYPEVWIHDCATDLHSVFKMFDGSMLVSLTLGLIDVKTGILSLLNAEHPFPVLYRDGKASFLQDQNFQQKIGIIAPDYRAVVKNYALHPGDVVFFGSDGKDDILLVDVHNNQRMNEDETLFLNTVEEAEGKLGKVVELLRSYGEWMDDLSILRLEILENTASWDQNEKEYLKSLQLLKTSLDSRETASVLTATEIVSIFGGLDPNSLYWVGLAYRKLKLPKKALLACERLYVIDPFHISNCILYCDLNLGMGKHQLAQQIWEHIQQHHTNDDSYKKSLETLKIKVMAVAP